MTRDDLIEAMALAAYNRMLKRRHMKVVDYFGANQTPEANACREDARAALAAIEAAGAVVVPREVTEEMLTNDLSEQSLFTTAAQIGWRRQIYTTTIAASPYRRDDDNHR